VVLVTAPDAVLVDDPRARETHRVKHRPDAEIGAFLTAYRAAFTTYRRPDGPERAFSGDARQRRRSDRTAPSSVC